MQDLLVRSAGDAFLVGERQIPKHNHRQLSFSQAQITDERQLELSVSSDIPYQRSWYYEVLEHSAEAVDLSRFNDGAMALFNHNRDDYIGVIERAWLKNGKLYNILRFDTHELAERILQSINNNIIRNVSIGYVIPIRVQKRNFELRAQVWSIQRDKLFPIHSDFENYTLERELVS